MADNKESVGFIGIGLMGKPMTLRLLEAGFRVNVWNRDRKKLVPVADAGALPAQSVEALVQASSLVMLCLADTAAVEAVVFGPGGVAEAGRAEKLLIDLSSIHPDATVDFARRIGERCGMEWVDAPVSGGVAGAEEGTLTIMAGGKPEAVERARPVLAPLSRRVTHMGGVGSGQVTKICNQMIVGCNVLVIAEMIALARRAGVDAAKIPEALSGGFADSTPLKILGPQMATETFDPVKWRVKTLLKDLSMAVDLAGRRGAATPMSGLAAQLMQLHGGRGYLEQDPATLIKLFAGE